MRGNRGRDTEPELLVRRLLRDAGFPGYRLHWKSAPGRPDIAYPGRRIAVFVNGCYWHRCPMCNPPTPKAHAAFWEAKFAANSERDKRVIECLETLGWTVVTIWECVLKSAPAKALEPLLTILRRGA